MADQRYIGTVFADMQDKDPELFNTLGSELLESAMWIWVEKYPDDFPERGTTLVGRRYTDAGELVIKPKQ